jgi:hypothetical protein
MMKKLILFILPILILAACKSGGGKNSQLAAPDSVLNQGVMEVSGQAMNEIIENISSPVEIAALLKKVGAPFSNKYLASTEIAENFISGDQQALNLGIYGADLGYINMYSKTSNVISYLRVIKKLSDDLNVGQFFDFSTLKRLASNNQNLDSLMYISVHSFNQMDKYLRDNKRGNLSALIITGVWIEGLYLATQVAKDKEDEQLSERIGEQKLILADLMLVLKNYSADPYFTRLNANMDEMKSLFSDVKITYEMGEPEAVEKDGMLTIVQNEKSIVHITKEQLKLIISTTEKVRNNLIGL